MKFRKKSVEIEASQFLSESEERDRPSMVFFHKGQKRHGIYTMNGFRHVNDGDWIITNPGGDYCVCSQEGFKETYESLE